MQNIYITIHFTLHLHDITCYMWLVWGQKNLEDLHYTTFYYIYILHLHVALYDTEKCGRFALHCILHYIYIALHFMRGFVQH